VSALVESVASKIQRQVIDLASIEGASEELNVDGVSAERYLTAFNWDEAKHPARRPLRETVEKLQESVAKMDDEFKVKTSEYSSVKGQLNVISRKAAGSLATRDIGELVSGTDLVDTENLTTLCVAVPKLSQKEWIESYETLAQFVVPRSSTLLMEDGDYALYTVTLFRRVVDAFKSAAREKAFQVRELKYDEEAIQAKASERANLKTEVEERRAAIYEWCQTSFGEVFSAWVHICAIRLFVESILRYGLPPSFQASVMKPHKNCEKKVRAVLSNTFGRGASSHWNDDPSEDKTVGEDTHPYVAFKIDV
jgi:V-type H+-transporting ATPase subunit C